VTRIREARPADADAILRIHTAAFGRSDEAELVRRVSQRAAECVSLVAEENGAIVGHVLFSPVTVVGHRFAASPMGLAPVAVSPELQRGGAGSALCRAGIEACRARGAPFVVVLGHTSYYPRFGFVPAARFGLHFAEFPPRDSFMALELVPGALGNARGSVRYAPEFHEA
jgi:putative acetyltransferase